MELDVLAVRLDADVQAFQQQLDRARASLSRFATGAAPAAIATEKVGAASTRSIPGLGRLGNALENVATRAAGLPGIVGKAADVLGSFAIGSGPMILVFAGLAGVAALFTKITEEARETKKAAEDAMKSVTNAWLSRQTQGDIDLIGQQRDIGAQLDAQTRKVQRAVEARENKEYLAKLNAELLALQTAYNQATELLTDRRTERQREAAERTARAEETAANRIASAHKRAYAEIEAAAKHYHDMHPALRDIALPFTRATDFETFNKTGQTRRAETAAEAAERLGFFIPAVSGATDALEELKNTFAKVAKQLDALLGTGSTVTTPGRPGFIGGIGNQLFGTRDPDTGARSGGILDPRLIASGLVTSFAGTAVNAAIGGLAKLGKSILGIGNEAQIAARQFQVAMANIQDAITFASGSDAEQAFVQARQQIQQLMEGLVGDIDLTVFGSFEELIQFFKDTLSNIRDMPDSEHFRAFTAGLELAEALFGNLNEELNNVTESLRNVPEGFKIALARFEATEGVAVATVARGVINNGTIIVQANDPDQFIARMQRRQFQRTGTAAGPLMVT